MRTLYVVSRVLQMLKLEDYNKFYIKNWKGYFRPFTIGQLLDVKTPRELSSLQLRCSNKKTVQINNRIE